MSVETSQKIRITIDQDHKIELLQFLQAQGIIQLQERSGDSHLDPEYQETHNTLLAQLNSVETALETLSYYQPSPSSPFQALFDNRIRLSEKEVQTVRSNQKHYVEQAQHISQLTERKQKLIHNNEHLDDVIQRSEPLKDIEINLFQDFRYVTMLAFMVDENRSDYMYHELEEQFSDIVIESLKKINQSYVYVVAAKKEQAEELRQYVHNYATLLTFDQESGNSFHEIYQSAIEKKEAHNKELKSIEQELSQTSLSIEKLYIIKDIIHSQYAILSGLHYYQTVGDKEASLEAWADPRYVEHFKSQLYSQFSQISLEELSSSQENPIVMNNSGLIQQFETVTRIMGLPRAGGIDPTPVLTLFFAFMFGLAFSEAGYALVLLAISGFLLLKSHLKAPVRKVMAVIFTSSIVTLIVGALFGSWFGLNPQEVVASEALPHTQFFIDIGLISLLQNLQVITPLTDIIGLIGFTLALGIIHLLFGLVIAMIQASSQKQGLDGALNPLLWFFFVILAVVTGGASTGLLGAGVALLTTPLIIIMSIYMVLMVALLGRHVKNPVLKPIAGLYELFFGAIGYLSDTLSYVRLVALGLATGVIAGVIGTLARLAGEGLVESGGLGLIGGYLIMIAIFLLGHTVNIALAVLGAYVNVGRLHFVEFFGKFFQPGGQELKPFTHSQKHIIIEKS